MNIFFTCVYINIYNLNTSYIYFIIITMEQLTNTSYLCNQLIEINKKYENNNFIDMDFIDLFGLQSQTTKTITDIDKIKKKLTAKYYNLALKYHPDKFSSSVENIINIKNCFVSTDEIKSGEFLSFINDIYEMFNNMFNEDPESLINIINGKTDDLLNKFDINGDFNNLKRRFDTNLNSKEYLKATNEQMRDFEEELGRAKIADLKINEDQLKSLILEEQDKRENLKIERLFTQEEQIETGFNKKFNDVFDTTKTSYLNSSNETFNETLDEKSNNILAFNFNNNYDLSVGVNSIGLSTSITDINEAFGPIRVTNNLAKEHLSYDELLIQRRTQEDLFKIPKNQKHNSS